MDLDKPLILLGLTSFEIKFFKAGFSLGWATIPEICQQAKIRRSTGYLIAQKLLSQNLLLSDHKTHRARITTVEPHKLLQLISSKQRQFRRLELELESALPDLQSLHQASEIRPKVKVYEGNTGLLQIWQDILSTKSEILLWTNQQTENQFFGDINHDKFIAERLRKTIPIRVLATSSPESQELQRFDNQKLRQTKILPLSMKFSAETYIYDHKIAMLDYNKDIIGIIIESKPISDFHKANFELVWQNY